MGTEEGTGVAVVALSPAPAVKLCFHPTHLPPPSCPQKRSSGIPEWPIVEWIGKTGFKPHEEQTAQISFQEITRLVLRVLPFWLALKTEHCLAQGPVLSQSGPRPMTE